MEHLSGLAEIVGPIGVLVVVVAWAIISRRQNGRGPSCRSGCPPIVIARLDGIRDDIGEVRADVRDLRASLVRHLEDHAHT